MSAFPVWIFAIDLSGQMAEFNLCLASAHAAGTVVMTRDRV
jgi:hypothetical protein